LLTPKGSSGGAKRGGEKLEKGPAKIAKKGYLAGNERLQKMGWKYSEKGLGIKKENGGKTQGKEKLSWKHLKS